MLSKRERFQRILLRQPVDRSLYSAWYHFIKTEADPRKLADATIEMQRKYNWDWLKVNPSVIHLAQVFGNEYDYSQYQGVYPLQTKQIIQTADDLGKVQFTTVKRSRTLREHTEMIDKIIRTFPELPVVATIFSPLSILFLLLGCSPYVHQNIYGSNTKLNVIQILKEYPKEAQQALLNITKTLIDYINVLEQGNIDGIFYAVTGTGNRFVVPKDIFEEFSMPYDIKILKATKKSTRIILHTCKDYSNPKYFDQTYPIDGISWDSHQDHNPRVDDTFLHTIVGGIDHKNISKLTSRILVEKFKSLKYKLGDGNYMISPECIIPESTSSMILNSFNDNWEKGNS
ncbi:uroporphyrinogen decarboxylase family protein [Loigolactobacillus binensis]|uniref:Uroporphyrinogen decarboxylase family protein n=1 Tax=Loigolactobacillus binensis TaxID=2559922 RepID=A0ABW3EGH0_9LACO|nr:uroporphyrinogen decarboxylase family protein [Loigolactobacillus binensis]